MRPIVLDCDPGVDDALAILLAAAHLDVVAITTVAGNQSLEKVTTNALAVLELAELTHVPVHPGAARPLLDEPRYAQRVHGESGLDGADLPPPRTGPSAVPAVEAIRAAADAHGDLTLVATGPLTNVAVALRLHPGLVDRLSGIVLMGGSLAGGNTSPAAEFNVAADPEAARVVFTAGVPIRMVGLNLTEQARVGADETRRMRALGNRVGRVCADLVDAYIGRVRALVGIDSAALHDPCAVAWLIEPGLIDARAMHVDVELAGELTRGMTVCDARPLDGGPLGANLAPPRGGRAANAEVGLRLDVARFLDLLLDALARYP